MTGAAANLAPGARAPDKRDRRRAEIVLAATAEMNEHGVQGLVLADVASRVGMTKANLTYYFRRKEELAAVCIARTLDAYRAMVAQAARRETAAERLLALFEAFFARAARADAGLETPLIVLSSPRALAEPHGADAIRQYVDLLGDAAALFDAPGAPPLGRLDRLTRAQLALTHLFWAAAWIRQCDPGDYPRIARRLFDIAAHGLVAGDAEGAATGAVVPMADPDEPRAEFYRAATRTINLLGYRGASVDRISTALNATKGAVYHHHPSKDELVAACSQRSFARMWSIIRAVESASDDPAERLAGLTTALVAFQTGERGPFLRASVLGTLPAPLCETLTSQWARIVHHLSGLVSDGVAEGRLRPVDAFLAAQVIAASINAADEIGAVLLERGRTDIGAYCVEPVLHGLLSPRRPALAAP